MAVAEAPNAAPVKQLRAIKGEPDALFDLPTLEKDEEFKDAPQLETIVQGLIKAFPDRFTELAPLTIRCAWKAHGRTTRGREIMGFVQRPGGYLKHLLEDVDYVLYVAVDHCRNQGMTNYTMEAQLFNLLCQCFVDDEGRCTILSPDWQGFTAEVRAYGLWREDLKIGARAFRDAPQQLSLDDLGEGDE